MPCSRTQHGLTRVGLEPPTSESGVRGINHEATALQAKLCIHLNHKEAAFNGVRKMRRPIWGLFCLTLFSSKNDIKMN